MEWGGGTQEREMPKKIFQLMKKGSCKRDGVEKIHASKQFPFCSPPGSWGRGGGGGRNRDQVIDLER